jgi:transcriptional regulator with XRE-family HTH domain
MNVVYPELYVFAIFVQLAYRTLVTYNSYMRSKYKEPIIKLRQGGRSYNEIARALGISKGTVSYWLHGVPLRAVARQRLQKNIDDARKRGLFAFNRRRTRAVKHENLMIRRLAAREIKMLSSKALFLLGVALYWGEGVQRESIRAGSNRLSFANSDPHMIAIFMRFIREKLKISDERIRPAIHIHPYISKKSAVRYWSNITKLPPDRFVIVCHISRASNRKRPVRSLPFGTVHIRVNDRRLFFRMKGWIDGLKRNSFFK